MPMAPREGGRAKGFAQRHEREEKGERRKRGKGMEVRARGAVAWRCGGEDAPHLRRKLR